jgi:hypothetical protein
MINNNSNNYNYAGNLLQLQDGNYTDATIQGEGSQIIINNNAVTYPKMQSTVNNATVLGKSSIAGTIEEITSTSDNQVLRRSSGVLGWATLSTNNIDNSAITYSKIQNVTTNNRLLGRATSGAGTVEEITLGSNLSLSGTTLNASSGGLTNFTESSSTTGVNSTVYANRLIPNVAVTNSDFVVSAKGTGSILANLPDGTTTGGNKRGNNSIDLQVSRSASTQIAGATRSTIIGGVNNTIGSVATESVVYGGSGNTINGSNCGTFNGGNNTISSSAYAYCVQVGGQTNNITNGQNHAQVGGASNTIGGSTNNIVMIGGASNTNNSANKSAMIGGEQNTMSASGVFLTGSSIIGGRFNVLSGTNNGGNSIIGGISNSLDGQYSVCLGGNTNTILNMASNSVCLGGDNNYIISSFSRTSGRSGYNNINGSDIISNSPSTSVKGSNQAGRIIMSVKTSSTSATKLITPASNALEIMDGESVAYQGIICARTSSNPGKSAYYEINGLVRNSGGVLTLLYSNLNTRYTDDATWVITQQCPTYWLEVLFTGDTNTFVTCHMITSHSKWIAS